MCPPTGDYWNAWAPFWSVYQGSVQLVRHHYRRCLGGGKPQCPGGRTWDTSTQQCGDCPTGNVWNGTQCVDPNDPGKGAGGGGCQVGNPCNPANGNKYLAAHDVWPGGDGVPGFSRHYNSLLSTDRGLGHGWTSPAYKRLEIRADGRALALHHPDGRREPFFFSGQWQGDPDTRVSLTQDSSGYNLFRADGSAEWYNQAGRLVYERDPGHRRTNYSYDANGRLSAVSEPFGHTLRFAYDASGHVSTITDAGGRVITYEYDANNNLVRVTYPDGTAIVYHYENASFPYYLTGISHDNGSGNASRYATYAYDANGLAILTEHAGGQQRFTLSYDSASQTRVTDAAGTQEVMSFEESLGVKNLVGRANQADGKSLAQTFDASNNLTCKKDEEGRVTTYTYNATNQRVSLTEGQSGTCANPVPTSVTRTTTYQYVSPAREVPIVIESSSLAAGQVKRTVLTYGNTSFLALPTNITQSGYTPGGSSVSRTLSLEYNPYGRVTRIDGPRGDLSDVTSLAYNVACTTAGYCGQLSSVTNPLGHVTNFDTYDAAGRLLLMTDPNGLKTAYTYDPRGRVATVTLTPPSGSARVTGYSYNVAGNVTETVLPDGRTLTYTYNAAQELVRITDTLGNRIDYAYDSRGNRTQESTYDPDGTLVRAVGLAYDLRNRTATINAAGSLTQQIHDAVGNVVSATDPNGNPTAHGYDALNRLIQTIDALGGATAYGYDRNDRLAQVSAPNGATTGYVYDDLGNLLREESPDRGTLTYTYDEAGNVTSMTDARGVTAQYAYDALNRVTLIDYPGEAEDVSYTYDACTLGRGRVCAVADASGTTQYAYNAFGNVTQMTRTELGVAYTTAFLYDAMNRVTRITYPGGRVVNYTYDAAGRLASVSATVNGVSTPLSTNRTHRADGLLRTDVRQRDCRSAAVRP